MCIFINFRYKIKKIYKKLENIKKKATERTNIEIIVEL